MNAYPGVIITHADSPGIRFTFDQLPGAAADKKHSGFSCFLLASLPLSVLNTHTHTHTHMHSQPPSLHTYIPGSRRHQWIAFMQNASITGKTKRPCQGRGVVTGAGKRFYAVLI